MRWLLILTLSACSTPNHLGNPLTLPLRGLLAGAQNAAYDAKRAKVKAYLTAHEAALRTEKFDGPTSAPLYAPIPPARHAQIRAELQKAATTPDFIERATVILMVYRAP